MVDGIMNTIQRQVNWINKTNKQNKCHMLEFICLNSKAYQCKDSQIANMLAMTKFMAKLSAIQMA